ncbi:FUSC family protein [Pigmentiphaga sp.]|uniref:FUSC family protein n=1 Tax=Pigmentiphaga sp. TaxID=1977564 RepID=UPI0025E794A5|nr:FUSC family protein [Pigmentiphaga sp.]MBX6317013.1 FUSC family protein [Pigmentiphaga sp.]
MIAWRRRWQQRDRTVVDQALRLAAAAWLSFAIAASLHVENAYWAAMPVWVITQATRGLLLGRAIYRILGTLLGAALGFSMLHLPLPVPAQLALAALFIGMCAGASHLLHGVRSYAPLMAAITTAVVVVPSALDLGASIHLARERVECTLIGVVVTTLVMAFWTLPSARQQFYRSVRQLAGDALALAARVVAHASGSSGIERRILIEIGDLEARSALVRAGSRDGHRRQRHIDALVVATLEIMAATYALAAQVRRGFQVPGTLLADLKAASVALGHGAPDSQPGLAADTWQANTSHAHPAVRRLVEAMTQITLAEKSLFASASVSPADADDEAALDAPRDWAQAWRTASTSFLVALFAVNLVHLTGSPMWVPMAMALCIFSIVLGTLPLPQQIAPVLFTGVCAGVVASIAYRLWLQPMATSPIALILSVLPFFLVGAFARTHPRTALAAIDANMCFMLASQAGREAQEADVIIGESAAMLMGTAMVSAGFMLLPRLPHKRAAVVAQELLHDIERLLSRPLDAVSVRQWPSRTYRKMLLLMVHLGRANRFGEDVPRSLLAALNLGHAIESLQRNAQTGDEVALQALAALRPFVARPHAVGDALRRLAGQPRGTESATLVQMAADALQNCQALLYLARIRNPALGGIGD